MKKIKIYTGIINNQPEDMESLQNAFRIFNGYAVDITIEQHKIKRSNPQNSYLWGVVYPLIQKFLFESQNGFFTNEEIHEYYKSKGKFGKKEITIYGKTEVVNKGSSECSTIEFKEIIEDIQREWAERGLIIPDPNQTEFLDN